MPTRGGGEPAVSSRNRPARITAVSWLAIVWGLFTLIVKVFSLVNNDAFVGLQQLIRALNAHALVALPLSVHLGYSLAASVVLVLSGCFMLRGQAWAWALFLVWGASSLFMTLLTYGVGVPLFARMGTFAVLVFLVTWGSSSRFFTWPDVPGSEQR